MKNLDWNWNRIVRTGGMVIVLVALYLLIRRLSGVLLPFLISWVVAFMLNPIVNFFQRKCRLKNRVLSVIVTVVLALGVGVGAVWALASPIRHEVATVSAEVREYVSNVNPSDFLTADQQESYKQLIQSLDVQALMQNGELQHAAKALLPKLGSWVSSGISTLAGLAIVFVCFLYVIFLLIDFEAIDKQWTRYIPARYRSQVGMLVDDLMANMNAYFRSQALIAFIVGILFAIGFRIIGLPLGIVMGIIIGIFNLVPYMQALGIPPCILLGLLQSWETGRPVWVVMLCILAVFVVVQSLQDMLLTPKIMGNVTGMRPAWILLALSVWGSLLGVVGMIIALPVTTLLVSYYKRFILGDSEADPASDTEVIPEDPTLEHTTNI